jgi:hypothetical protein
MAYIDDFEVEVECVYKKERYSVRDNGAILRHPRDGKCSRRIDNKWTFGKSNDRTSYMEIASVRVHRIVATAFHGEPPTKEHVVDHIDTNKRNNRAENLRWVTRLENVLLNSITAKRIAYVCGSVEAFLSDPRKYRDMFSEPYEQWMRTVSAKEAQISLERMLAWANNDNPSRSGERSLDKWIFTRKKLQDEQTIVAPEEPDFIKSLTPGAVQHNWRTLSEFPCTPHEMENSSLTAYADNLKEGTVFSQNIYGSSLVINSGFSEDRQTLYVMTESSDSEKSAKRYALAEVTYEDNLFVHTGRTFFSKEGAEKQFSLSQGLEWTGGDSIDDYC